MITVSDNFATCALLQEINDLAPSRSRISTSPTSACRHCACSHRSRWSATLVVGDHEHGALDTAKLMLIAIEASGTL